MGRLAEKAQPGAPFAHRTEVPEGRKATCVNITASCQPQRAEKKRARLTACGDQTNQPSAKLTAVKLLLNGAISTEDTKLMTRDLKDFFLETPVDRHEGAQAPVKDAPQDVMDQCNLAHHGRALEKQASVCTDFHEPVSLPTNASNSTLQNMVVTQQRRRPACSHTKKGQSPPHLLSMILVLSALAENAQSTLAQPSKIRARPPKIGKASCTWGSC